MNKINVIIIDDEQSARNVLKNLLSRNPLINIAAECSNLIDGVDNIKKHKPDLVLLDVEMPNYAGYEIADFFDIINFEIIFATAYDKYAVKAFELNAVDYLVKPIEREKLETALQKIQKRINQKKNLIDYKKLLVSIKEKTYKQIIIPELGNRRVINIDDIVAIKADGAYSKIYLIDRVNFVTSKNLKYFNDILEGNKSFFRTHRTWIVNLNYVDIFNKTDKTTTLAKDMLTVKISRTRVDEFEKSILF